MKQRNLLLIDGATGSELDRAGVDIGMPLWSANAILEAPEILKQIHIAYLEAGAQAITANTFRTHERSLTKVGMGNRAEELTAKAVEIACSARDEVNSDAAVFGSVAPLEDCYSPELAPASEVCEREHGQLIRHLVNAGVDLVLIETMCSAGEVCAASVAAMENTEHWAVSFCLQQKGVGILLDGNPISEFVPALTHARFVGINCYPATELAEQVKHLCSLLPEDMPIAAYGNVGYTDKDGGWVSTDAIEPAKYASYAMDWIDAGASIIGGCCGTTPATINEIQFSLNKHV
jgi:S-methylmethionine-dependent homocysteine/selenocysteine methylase